MEFYCESLTEYRRLRTREVKIGDLLLGNPNGTAGHPIRVQTMTTTDTMDTSATVEQSIRCIEAGSELIRITAPSKREAENLLNIKNALRRRGYTTPIVADIHFTPNAAEIAARIVEKVRVNPGNYVDKKKFEIIEYSDAEYQEEIDRIRDRFTPLIKICKEFGTAMRIGTNHGSLSDRIMSRYGDTPIGMVESAMEFLRIARDENYHQIVLSMKSSNPQVMVHAYRLLVKTMMDEFGECYPLHLGVTEAGDGEDGRIKSAIGTGTLLEDGLGDTIRVSLTEDPELEIPVCRDIIARYQNRLHHQPIAPLSAEEKIRLPYDPFDYLRRNSFQLTRIGQKNPPVVVADYMQTPAITSSQLEAIGYKYDVVVDKWNINDAAADFIYTGDKEIEFALPGTLQVICNYSRWLTLADKTAHFPLFQLGQYLDQMSEITTLHFVVVDADKDWKSLQQLLDKAKRGDKLILCLESSNQHRMPSIRRFLIELMERRIHNPVILCVENSGKSVDEQLIDFATDIGGLMLDGFGDGIWIWNNMEQVANIRMTGRTYLEVKDNYQFLNTTAFSILQASRTRISKTEYISCPSCGRTLFDLQETTARIRAVTNHLKGVKIAIMGCIVNGPGEMADADFGYVGSGPGKITLYKGKDIVKRNVNSEVAVQELIQVLKENGAWLEPETVGLGV